LSFKALATAAREEKTAEVKIGGEAFTVKAVLDPTIILSIEEEAKARAKLKPMDIDGQPVKPKPEEIKLYLYLAAGLVSKEKVEYVDVVRVSRTTGLQCIEAGMKVMQLSGLAPETPESDIATDAKND
jgi:hypothetical protein